MKTNTFYKYNFDDGCPDFVGLSIDKRMFASDSGAMRRVWFFDKPIKRFSEFVNKVGVDEYAKFKGKARGAAFLGLAKWYFAPSEFSSPAYADRAVSRVVKIFLTNNQQ